MLGAGTIEKIPPLEIVDVDGAVNLNCGGIESDFVGEGDRDGSGSLFPPGVPKENSGFFDALSSDSDVGLKLNPANGLGV